MYCVNCGKEIEEGCTFCPHCGNNTEPATDKKTSFSFNKKSILVLAGLIACILLVFKISKSNNVNASPENVAKAAVISEYEADIDMMIKCFPDFTIRELAWEYGLSEDASRNEVKNQLKEAYRYEEVYDVRNIETEVIDIYDIDDSTFIKELYDDMTDKEFYSIAKMAKVRVSFELDGDDENVQLTCIKIKGKWYLLRKI